jgi:hypothetical protein
MRRALVAALALALPACSSKSHPPAATVVDAGPTYTFAQASDEALATMASVFYEDAGAWSFCEPTACSNVAGFDYDWGADSMTAALTMRWQAQKDPAIRTMMTALDANAATYGTCTAQNCPSWSDVPLWDAIAAAHEYGVLGGAVTLARGQSAFAYVDTATQFALGACPSISYQQPGGGTTQVKTLETDSNYIQAALLLHQLAGDDAGSGSYLAKAIAKYASVRQYFLDPSVSLYTVYVVDDGTACTPIARRFYASVNGNMIWNGIALAGATGQASYLNDAIATATAVTQDLSDANGIYADLQTDDDVIEPLIEAMYVLGTQQGQQFALDWLHANARAIAGARTANGTYGRFFDGPPPPAQATEWQANGGLALAFVAGALWPAEVASAHAEDWSGAVSVTDDLQTLPSSIQFTGRGIAVFGTLGDQCCHLGQAEILVDGVETFDQTGIHQNESEAFGRVPDSVLFAWRWPTSGSHTITLQAGATDPKNGGPYLHVQRYAYLP